MGDVLIVGSARDDAGVVLGSAQRFGSFGCGGWDIGATGSEAQQQAKWRGAGTISQWSVRVRTNSTTGSSTFALRKNGAAANSTASIGSGATGEFTDASHTDTLADADLVCWNMTIAAGGSGLCWVANSAVFTPNSGTLFPCVASGATGTSTASSTYFSALQETFRVDGAEDATKMSNQLGAGAVLSFLQAYVSANARTTTTTVRTRVNGGNGAQSVSIGSSATGLFEDTTHTDTLAANDDVNTSMVTGTGTGTITIRLVHVNMAAPAATQQFTHFFYIPTVAMTAATTFFAKMAGSAAGTVQFGTEALSKVKARLSRRAGLLRVRVSANATSGASSVDLRVNGASPTGQPVVSIGSAATGAFSDTTDWYTLTPTDDINTRIVVGAGGTLTMSSVQLSYLFTPSLVFPSINRSNSLIRR